MLMNNKQLSLPCLAAPPLFSLLSPLSCPQSRQNITSRTQTNIGSYKNPACPPHTIFFSKKYLFSTHSFSLSLCRYHTNTPFTTQQHNKLLPTMIEVDVFWSFSFGAVFAACSAGTLKHTPHSQFWSTPSFVYTLLFLSLIFAPSGLYLLWDNPGWESMFVLGDKNEIHALLPTAFAFTNVLLGIIGYYMTYRSIRRHREESVLNMGMNKYWIHAYTCFCAILGMGYNRFLYPSGYQDWRAGKVFELTDFAFSRMLATLLAMGVVLLPVNAIPFFILFAIVCTMSWLEQN